MSAKTKSERLRRLISHGYFAPELPPCFVADDLAKHRASILAAIDALPKTKNGGPAVNSLVTEPLWFYFPRFGKNDRRHGVPNPVAHLALSRVLANNYVALRKIALTSKFSLSPPVFDWTGPRALSRPSVDLRDEYRVELSSRREIYVAADLRAFFHSIYTHAIPWAIHTKAVAKKNRSAVLFGNVIDQLCRNAQDGQTIGLPVGPDTSRLIAEVLASAMDAELQRRLKIGRHDGSRYIDDYTLSSPRDVSGEELLAALRQVAADFELELNNDKSAILSTSQRQSTGWQRAVRKLIPQPALALAPVETVELQGFFYELGRLCQDHPDINIEKFGLQNARSALVAAGKWKPVQSNLISAYRRNPSLVSFLVEVCLLRQVAQADVLLDDLTEFIENRMVVLARENRTGEAVWLLFLALRLGLQLSAKRLAPFFIIDNALVALLIVCLDHRGQIEGKIDRSGWDKSLTADGLRGPMWLYAYEAVAQGFVPGASDAFITMDDYFSALHAKKVRFLEVERGFTSIAATMKTLRSANERLERLRAAISNDDQDDLDEFEEYDEEDGDDDFFDVY
jgi:hypothetical protein